MQRNQTYLIPPTSEEKAAAVKKAIYSAEIAAALIIIIRDCSNLAECHLATASFHAALSHVEQGISSLTIASSKVPYQTWEFTEKMFSDEDQTKSRS